MSDRDDLELVRRLAFLAVHANGCASRRWERPACDCGFTDGFAALSRLEARNSPEIPDGSVSDDGVQGGRRKRCEYCVDGTIGETDWTGANHDRPCSECGGSGEQATPPVECPAPICECAEREIEKAADWLSRRGFGDAGERLKRNYPTPDCPHGSTCDSLRKRVERLVEFVRSIAGPEPYCGGRGATQDADGVKFTVEQQATVDRVHRAYCRRCRAAALLAEHDKEQGGKVEDVCSRCGGTREVCPSGPSDAPMNPCPACATPSKERP